MQEYRETWKICRIQKNLDVDKYQGVAEENFVISREIYGSWEMTTVDVEKFKRFKELDTIRCFRSLFAKVKEQMAEISEEISEINKEIRGINVKLLNNFRPIIENKKKSDCVVINNFFLCLVCPFIKLFDAIYCVIKYIFRC